ncbi:hypothetical protein OS493_015901 [Desmophyllum pertusum]|uniref:Calcineurin-like phosphoesterase domain-containing protein n=1 Tax=Desmophyllum pertusum TaxID=174260 RepID=A0A9W9YCM5_9CNID|nr:hypothetical protein OS493_015901 [Desmophyllum pertusum]
MEQTSHRKENVLLFVPNLIGYVRLVLLLASWIFFTNPVLFLSFYTASVLLDGERTMLLPTILAEECCGPYFYKEHSGGALPNPPSVMGSKLLWLMDSKHQLVHLPCAACMGFPVWLYGLKAHLWVPFMSHHLQLGVTGVLISGRALCMGVEVWFIISHIKDLLAENQEQKTPLPSKRVLFVGDVHGCFDELEELYNKCTHPDKDTVVVFVGDLVFKGPKTLEVIRFARETGSFSVRGNHEQSVLTEILHKRRDEPVRGKRKFVYDLTQEDEEFLQNLPFTISIPSLNVLVVHGGLLPGVPLPEQDPLGMIFIRNYIPEKFQGTSQIDDGFPWASMWNGPSMLYLVMTLAGDFSSMHMLLVLTLDVYMGIT